MLHAHQFLNKKERPHMQAALRFQILNLSKFLDLPAWVLTREAAKVFKAKNGPKLGVGRE
jgi:hypothetical protein